MPQQQEREQSRDSEQPLFRCEVLDEQSSQWLGTVLLTPRLSCHAFTAFAVLAIAAIICLLFFGDYTRKARISGWLVPQLGLMRVFAPMPGVVVALPIKEGDRVDRGAPLVQLSADIRSEALGATGEEVVKQLRGRLDSTAAERARQEQIFSHQKEQLADRLRGMVVEQQHLDREIELQRARLLLSEQTLQRYVELQRQRLVANVRVDEAAQDRLDQAARLQGLERTRVTLQREQLQLEGELRELPLKHQTQLAAIDRDVATLNQGLLEAEARREMVITAPQPGTVTAIHAGPGTSVSTTAPLLSIVPSGSSLEAQLFSPSRAVGFVRPGQQVLLRYEAFPYQKFGFHRGTVTSVSRTAVNAAEFAHIGDLTSLYGAAEPLYRIIVAIGRQTVTAYGDEMPLQPGMQVDADVLLERRRLFEWMLDPLYTLTGKS